MAVLSYLRSQCTQFHTSGHTDFLQPFILSRCVVCGEHHVGSKNGTAHMHQILSKFQEKMWRRHWQLLQKCLGRKHIWVFELPAQFKCRLTSIDSDEYTGKCAHQLSQLPTLSETFNISFMRINMNKWWFSSWELADEVEITNGHANGFWLLNCEFIISLQICAQRSDSWLERAVCYCLHTASTGWLWRCNFLYHSDKKLILWFQSWDTATIFPIEKVTSPILNKVR